MYRIILSTITLFTITGFFLGNPLGGASLVPALSLLIVTIGIGFYAVIDILVNIKEDIAAIRRQTRK